MAKKPPIDFKKILTNDQSNLKDAIKKTQKQDSGFKPKNKENLATKKKFPKFSFPKFNIFEHLHRKKSEKKKGKIELFKKKAEKKKSKIAVIQERRHKFKFYLERAGLVIDPHNLSKKLFTLCVVINLIISAVLIYHFSTNFGITWTTILISIATVWILIFASLLIIFWVMFYLVVDLRIFKRKLDIEDVFPDFLQLTASNIKSGMTIDRALWYAVRPRFGVLAKEIEIVAKETMRGQDLKIALQNFADKYDSILLKRSISLLIEGLESGGQIGNLLNKIAVNIQENKIMKKEMASNITTYVIFISFASVLAAPALFALSGVLITVIGGLGESLGGPTSGSGLAISFSGAGISIGDFKIFAITSLVITSFFSAVIVSTMKHGNIKEGIKYIPIFIIVSVSIFLKSIEGFLAILKLNRRSREFYY